MPKRSAEPRIELHDITKEMTLRIRFADHNIDGSVMLILNKTKFMECVMYKETSSVEYNEENWIQRYHAMYDGSLETTPDEELIEENKTAKDFNENTTTTTFYNSELAGPMSMQNTRIKFVSWENNVLKLKAEREIKCRQIIDQIKHTSMHLTFAEFQ